MKRVPFTGSQPLLLAEDDRTSLVPGVSLLVMPAEDAATSVLWADRPSPRTGIKLRRATKKDQIHFIGLPLLSSGLHWGGKHQVSRNGKTSYEMARLYSTVPIGSKHHSTFSEGLVSGLVISVDSILEEAGAFDFPENYWKSVRSMASTKAWYPRSLG